jgi:hypothetical protein
MSILNDLLKGKITFKTAATEAATWVSQIVGRDANLAGAMGTVLSDLKQGASNAVALAETDLGGYIASVTSPLETALEAMLAKATGGASLPFNPLITHSIDTIAAAVKAEVDAWATKTKAGLAAPGQQPPTTGA